MSRCAYEFDEAVRPVVRAAITDLSVADLVCDCKRSFVDAEHAPGALIGAVALLLASCSSAPSHATTSTTTAPIASSPTPTTPTTFGGVVGRASANACLTDARQVEQASEIYQATHGSPAPSLGALVADGHLETAPSTNRGYVITYDPATGKVTASGACRFP